MGITPTTIQTFSPDLDNSRDPDGLGSTCLLRLRQCC